MKTKLLVGATVFFGVIALVSLVSFGILPRSQSTTAHAQSDLNTNPVMANSTVSTSISTAVNSLRTTKSGLTAEIREYDLNPNYPTVTICTDLPSVDDWLPIFSASFNGNTIGVWQVMLIDPEGIAPEMKNRCYLAMLDEGIFQPDKSGTLNFNLEYFQVSLPEKLPDDLIAKAKKSLKNKGLDIDFEMKDVDHGQIVVIKSKPASYTDEQTYQAIQQAIASAPEKFDGPWEFTIEVKP